MMNQEDAKEAMAALELLLGREEAVSIRDDLRDVQRKTTQVRHQLTRGGALSWQDADELVDEWIHSEEAATNAEREAIAMSEGLPAGASADFTEAKEARAKATQVRKELDERLGRMPPGQSRRRWLDSGSAVLNEIQKG